MNDMAGTPFFRFMTDNGLLSGSRLYGADDVEVNDITSGAKITTNAGFARYCHDVNYFEFGAGDNFLTARWTFAQTGLPVTVKGDSYLGFNINDDLRTVVDFTVMCQGIAYE